MPKLEVTYYVTEVFKGESHILSFSPDSEEQKLGKEEERRSVLLQI